MAPLPLFRRALTAAAGTIAATGIFFVMDANPSLYLFDKLVATDRRLQKCYRGKRIWITGASSGIGAELAQLLSSKGANLILSSRSKERLEEVATKCQQYNNNILVLPLDVTCSQQELEKAVDIVLEQGDDLDCVVFNAGRGHQTPALETTHEVSLQMMQLNALGPMDMARTILQKTNWRHKQRGQFVVVSSVAGKFAVPLSASYAASKRALHGYFESLGSEFPWLQINMVCPGPVATPFHGSSNAEQASKRLQMPVQRCARLIMSNMAMGGGESWIAEQPTLLVCFLAQYFPRVATLILKKVGPIRVAMWQQGLDLYDPSSLRKVKMPKNEVKNE